MKGNLLKKAFLSILALMMFVSPLSLQAAEETTE